MYEARKFLLGLESNGVSSSSAPVLLNPAPNGPSPSLICPVGLDILASAGLGLSSLGNGSSRPSIKLGVSLASSSVRVFYMKACSLREWVVCKKSEISEP